MFQFVVIKFESPDAPDEVNYDVGLVKWLDSVDPITKRGLIRWPPTSLDVGKLVRNEKPYKTDWECQSVVVKSYYGKTFSFLFFSSAL